MTWNLWWRFGDWRVRRAAIEKVITDVRPDICALQEVWADPDENLAGSLAASLGMHWAWGPPSQQARWQQRVNDAGVHIGVALLSRWPIVEPRAEDLHPDQSRSMLSAIIEAPYGRIPVATAHLTATGGQSATRTAQVEKLLRVIGDRLTPEHPPIVAGDFNAHADSDEMRLLGGDLTRQVVPDLVLHDAWSFAEPDERGFTWDRRNPYVAMAPDPSGRIDYIRVGLRYDLTVGRVQSVRLVATGPVDGVWASDHAAIVAELSEP